MQTFSRLVVLFPLYDAFREAGASEDKARPAAEVVYTSQDAPWKRRVEKEFAELHKQLAVLRWMVGYLVAVTTGILWKTYS